MTANPERAIRTYLVEGLLGMALTQANVLWRELEELGYCAEDVGELVDLVLATMAQLDEVKKCVTRGKRKR